VRRNRLQNASGLKGRTDVKFLCLCYYDLDGFARFGPADFEEMGRICAPHDAQLKASGKVSLIGSLGMPDEYRTIRANSEGVAVSDGPYAETREPFGAFFIVEANSIDEAVEVARLHPGSHLGHMMKGGIEVRPIDQLEQL
jgi:hypothetical protein